MDAVGQEVSGGPLPQIEALIHARRTTLPKRLQGPGPDAAQKERILSAASAAPDHLQLLPWRLVEVSQDKRELLAQAFAQALLERDPLAQTEEIKQAREKAFRAPWLLLAICRTHDLVEATDNPVPASERLVSLGCALQNMMLICSALGLGSGLTSGKAMRSQALRALFGLSDQEEAVCCLNIGHIRAPRENRQRPSTEAFFSSL